ncbi:type IX secretion system membrane protein PorP/SprF [Flavobacterium arcticum]|uniref:Type IX secretion system membrane protein PorP/SprF n=1 Tax=Flavobacterium arcticum TaxID=1784713 RepID=A0A345H893_9FLAO|nr:type IX secretion system membrane protein PorP/SprF [Flavobacterium arcticum]AXG72803.1 type IX secretion system membrane protein PorP/SprF [Flavobacterium arcticum]KAF2510926.1 type IX secretion system membrane protein PorP/SprF [Flavobacterium arcticum]
MKFFFVTLKIGLSLLFVLAVQGVTAQQDPQYTQYMYNTLTVNPGYTGSTEGIDAILLHRSQWIGIDGAPRTQAFSVHSPIWNDKVGLGLSAINERIGPVDEFYIDGNFSYTLYLGEQGRLAFGLKAGARVLNIDWSRGRYYQAGDPLLNTNINNSIAATIGSGVYYYTDKWYAGVSIPNFIKDNYYDDIQETVVSGRLHYYVMGGYVFDVSDSVKFKPAILSKIVTGSPITIDGSANFLLQEKYTLGVAYRWDDAVSALAGFQLTKQLFIGYSYDYSTTELSKYNDGSHEILLRFQLQPKTTRIKSPRFF